MSIDETAMLLSGQLVRNHRGTFYFDRPGNWIDEFGWPIDSKRLHRVGGPAITWHSGTREWYVNGQRHRLDGPAIVDLDGTKEWYVNGKFIK